MVSALPVLVAGVAELGHLPGERLHDVYRAVGGDDLAFVRRAVDMGLVGESEAYRLYAEALGLAFETPDVAALDPIVMSVLPEDLVQRYRAVPLRVDVDGTIVAMENPLDLLALDVIQDEIGSAVVPVVCPPQRLRECIEQRLRVGRGIEGLLTRLDLSRLDQSVFASPQRLKEIAGDDAIVQLVDYLVEQAIRRRASDIHVEPGREQLRVRYRIDGELEAVQRLPKALHAAIVSRIKILCQLDIAERRKPQDGRFRFEPPGQRPAEFRVSTMPAVHGEKAVLRLLDKREMALDLEALGFTAAAAGVLRERAAAPNGIVLVTGPTGSGKTTTLYAVLATLNGEDRNLVSVEDPVEYEVDGVTQVQVDVKAERTFASVLRSLLRQDPDVIMVGEIRDRETAEIAVNAALTGHLVLSTLHTNSAVGAATRLLDMGVAGYLLGPTLRAIVAQRLVRRLCPACAEPCDPPDGRLLAELGVDLAMAAAQFRRPKGCPACRQRGYAGRVVVHEILPWSAELSSLLTRGTDEAQLVATARGQGFAPLLVDGVHKAAAGTTTLAEVLAAVRD